MKKFIVITLTMLAFCACDDTYNPYEQEIAINEDCTVGGNMSFDPDSIRCGWSESTRLRVVLKDDYAFNRWYDQYDLYLFSDSRDEFSKDSIWFFEEDADKLSTCEMKKMVNVDFPGTFCLKGFDKIGERELVSNYVDLKKIYFVYSKHGVYNAFCNVYFDLCFLRYSCVVQYDGTYNFSKVPDAEKDVKQKDLVGCILL